MLHAGSSCDAQLLEATTPGPDTENRQFICFSATSSHNLIYSCKLRGFVKVKTPICDAEQLKTLITPLSLDMPQGANTPRTVGYRDGKQTASLYLTMSSLSLFQKLWSQTHGTHCLWGMVLHLLKHQEWSLLTWSSVYQFFTFLQLQGIKRYIGMDHIF